LEPLKNKIYGPGGIWDILSDPSLTQDETQKLLNK
jgi:hypothetical protein